MVVRLRLARGFISTSPFMAEQMYTLEIAGPHYPRDLNKWYHVASIIVADWYFT